MVSLSSSSKSKAKEAPESSKSKLKMVKRVPKSSKKSKVGKAKAEAQESSSNMEKFQVKLCMGGTWQENKYGSYFYVKASKMLRASMAFNLTFHQFTTQVKKLLHIPADINIQVCYLMKCLGNTKVTVFMQTLQDYDAFLFYVQSYPAAQPVQFSVDITI